MAEIKNIRIAVSGIYEYSVNELASLQLSLENAPSWVELKPLYKVYRPASVLAAACEKFKLLPLTHHHPSGLVDSANFRDLVIGYTGENPFIDYIGKKDEVGIRSNVLLYDNEAQDAYSRGEVQLSPGYIARFAWQKGQSPQGESYDIVMQEIKSVNHLAILPAGRGGEDARVLDSRPTIFDIVSMTFDKEDANGLEHSDKNGQFTGKGDSGGEKSKKTNDEYRKEIKEKLKDVLRTDLPNDATGISATISSEGLNKMMSGKAIEKSINNGFTPQEHFEAVGNVVELFKKAKLIAVRPDEKHNDANVTIKRFVAQDSLKSGKYADFLFTVKETRERGHKIYSLELDEINKASKRWQHTKDGKAVYQPSVTGSLTTKSIVHDSENRKTIFEIVQGTVFDLYGAL